MKSNNTRRKPTGLLLRLVIRIPIVTLVFIVVVSIIININYKSWAKSYSNVTERIINEKVNTIQDINNTDGVKSVKNTIWERLASESQSYEYPAETFLRIIDRKTNECIIDSSQQAILLRADNDIELHDDNIFLKQYMYLCEPGEALNWMIQVVENEKKSKRTNDYLPIFQIEDYELTDSEHFLPKTIYAFSYDRETGETNCIGIFDENKGALSDSSSMDIKFKDDYYQVYVLGSNNTLADYPEDNKFWNDSHYTGGASEGHSYNYPPLKHYYVQYNRSFLKGDYMCVRRVAFTTYDLDDKNAGSRDYVLEYYFKSNFWETNKGRYLPPIFICYGICILIAFVIILLRYKRAMLVYEKEQYKNALIDSISHDLKSPLTALRGYAESLKENLNEEKKEAYADAIIDSTDYMDRLINGNISLLQLQDMHFAHKRDKSDLVELIKELFEKYGPVLEERNIILNISGNCEKKVNKDLITNALENLVSNSIKYVNDGGEIIVEGNGDSLKLANTVEVFPKRKPEELWETFVKGDDSRSNEKGSGIGLAIAKRIFDIHNIKSKIEYKEDENKQFVIILR